MSEARPADDPIDRAWFTVLAREGLTPLVKATPELQIGVGALVEGWKIVTIRYQSCSIELLADSDRAKILARELRSAADALAADYLPKMEE